MGSEDRISLPTRISHKRCDACGSPFDAREWYPVAFDETEATVVEFCSIGCRECFLAGE